MSELAIIEHNAIAQAFAEKGGVDCLFERIKQETSSHVFDMSTDKGRKFCASMAYKVSKAKTLVDDFGKDLVAEEKKKLALVDADRKSWREKCDILRDEIRKPLTEWEDAEKQRIQSHESNISLIKSMANVDGLDSVLTKARLDDAENIAIGENWQEYANQAAIAKDETIKLLKSALATRLQYESEQAELERLRQETIQNQIIERERIIAENAARQAKEDAERLARAEFERTERARLQAEAKEAQLLRDAELAKQREQAAIDAAKEAAKRAEIEKARAIENEKNRAIAQALREKQQQEAEDAERLANVNHRKKINNETLKSFIDNGIDETYAKPVMALIAKGLIKNVSIKY
jgi:colicin import membrane protein